MYIHILGIRFQRKCRDISLELQKNHQIINTKRKSQNTNTNYGIESSEDSPSPIEVKILGIAL
jgi:hypothetical protein